MNKQELIKEFEEIGIHGLNMFGTVVKGIPTETAIDLIKQLDEPQPVKVPQYVHKYIQEAKEYNWDLQDLMKYIDDEDSKDLQRWFYHECNQETLARAWLNGYEVDEEKRYLVKMKGMSEENTYLTFRFGRTWMLSNFEECEEFRLHHTRKELEESDFGRVFDCEGVEVQEVE